MRQRGWQVQVPGLELPSLNCPRDGPGNPHPRLGLPQSTALELPRARLQPPGTPAHAGLCHQVFTSDLLNLILLPPRTSSAIPRGWPLPLCSPAPGSLPDRPWFVLPGWQTWPSAKDNPHPQCSAYLSIKGHLSVQALVMVAEQLLGLSGLASRGRPAARTDTESHLPPTARESIVCGDRTPPSRPASPHGTSHRSCSSTGS